MANIYFEVKDSLANKWIGHRYFVTSRDRTVNFAQTSQNLTDCSDRVWCEQEGTVWFIKNLDPTTEVDMEEFMWAKLQAKDIN